ncbi:39S ribosomal protein L28 mitochondrial [Biomphalaria glabrata]|uniref:Large ribosomal subunit protein bL28m n=1 Tax=Biomphalaria glabrata TaxID=6526 RepID=A0A9U8EHI4_BIOGL|nr:39S ribosomal protein L28, mitochondrial-like [Biomphalaria glabrata]XP_013087464.2 39S ribosomal protein L28, mitochondrial-like [Biomphalaria glabrata]XP_013087465.2 39S ribosomal protein L28, mitochondrial-like [Biomphalaria glabrata]XP_013087466.2 39S ribosomal protein L28, mitochondrial-like [Biomphalaria glabrata]KAI8756692.1 39S ribosomal protein L28; mitochondrial-like [Biomphalaria glabrata]
MEKVKITRFMPSLKQMKDMVIHEVTYFERHNNSRFTVTSRNIPRWGTWINYFRSVPYLYKWSREEEALLPKHYKDRCIEFMRKEQSPVHWRPIQMKYRFDEDSGERIPVVNAPIPVIFPKECNLGLWGGEGIIFGYYKKNVPKKKHKLPTLPRIWHPMLNKSVLYSEILDRWMAIDVTPRALFLIDEAFGLDFYILKTHEVDLCSKLGMTLKREMLLTLANKSFYPNDPVKKEKIYNKYKEFIIPAEEAEWIGLSVDEAVEKAKKLNEAMNPTKPLKEQYLYDLCQKFQVEIKH